MKRIVLLLPIALLLAGCSMANTAVNNEQNTVNAQQAQYEKAQPVPFYDYSMQRQALIDIYNSQNQDQQTWDVVTSYSGQFLFQCEAVGWPIPADTQLTNPLQIAGAYLGQSNSTWESGVVGLAEPNGTYAGPTQGTYLLCIRNGKVSPVYTENNVQMFPFPVTVNPQTGAIQDAGGAATITLTVKSGGAGHAAPSASPSN